MRLLSSKLLQNRGVNVRIVSKKWSARPESIMNLSPSPLLSRVHVLKLKRKDKGVPLRVTCWLPTGHPQDAAKIHQHGPGQSRDDSLRNSFPRRATRVASDPGSWRNQQNGNPPE